MSYFIYTDLLSSLFDPILVDPGLTLIHVGAYGPGIPRLGFPDTVHGAFH